MVAEEEGEFVRLRRRNWARLIKKVYLEDPCLCASCGEPMRVVSAITSAHQDDVIEKILRRRGEWDPPWLREHRARGSPQELEFLPATADEFSQLGPAGEDDDL